MAFHKGLMWKRNKKQKNKIILMIKQHTIYQITLLTCFFVFFWLSNFFKKLRNKISSLLWRENSWFSLRFPWWHGKNSTIIISTYFQCETSSYPGYSCSDMKDKQADWQTNKQTIFSFKQNNFHGLKLICFTFLKFFWLFLTVARETNFLFLPDFQNDWEL